MTETGQDLAQPSGRGRRALRAVGIGTGLLTLLCAGAIIGPMRCWSAWFRWGIEVSTCPAGTPLPTAQVDVRGVGRAQAGTIAVSAEATYTDGPADIAWTTPLDVDGASVVLVRADGTETELSPKDDGWESPDRLQVGTFALPADLPDGDHQLRVLVDTPIGESVVTMGLPVFAPATVHMLTDRPLYEPGHTVSFRSVVLRARDLVPLGGRPGRFVVRDPRGETVFEEHAAASEWGVASSSIPLDSQAMLGTWSACWLSGVAEGCAPFEVTRFTLPRFTVSANSSMAWARRGDTPRFEGTVRLASGAPVADAEISVTWSVNGAWQPTHTWLHESLPTETRTDRAGRFSLSVPEIPQDLVDTATLVAHISATDPTGDRQATSATLLLSVDNIAAEAVSEIGEASLVDGLNNRLWVRATTPNGTAFPHASLTLERAWDPTAPPLVAEADEDGVAVFQVDPGAPVSVVVEEPPVRLPPPPPPIQLQSVQDMGRNLSAGLGDYRTLEAAESRLLACQNFVTGSSRRVEVVMVVEQGRVVDAWGASEPLVDCVVRAMGGVAMPSGHARVLKAGWMLQPAAMPGLSAQVEPWLGGAPDGLDLAIQQQLAGARICLPRGQQNRKLSPQMVYSIEEGASAVSVRWLEAEDGQADGISRPCLARSFQGLRLAAPADQAARGLVRLTGIAAPAGAGGPSLPQERVVTAYDLRLTARSKDGEVLGSTRLVLPPGQIPDFRLRAEPTLPQPGETVVVSMVRGPNFSGELPDKLVLRHADGSFLEAEREKDAKSVQFTLPADKTGWWSVTWAGSVSRVYVAPPGRLDVQISSDKDTYRPGEAATFTVRTTNESGAVSAAVSLFGVDETLSALAPLPGPDAMSSLQAQVPTPSPAFGALDGVALVKGHLRGENARMATILRVGEPPSPESLDAPVSVYGSNGVDVRGAVVDPFFPILAELLRQERAWERDAPAEDRLTPARAARLFAQARSVVQEAGGTVTDAYGRPLRLSTLPADLLELTAPHAIATDGARLPEDLENWAQWVAREEPK